LNRDQLVGSAGLERPDHQEAPVVWGHGVLRVESVEIESRCRKLGGLNELRLIPAKEVKEIRFVRAIDGVAFGVGRSGGAILIISKPGR
jgi:hypothetical protein